MTRLVRPFVFAVLLTSLVPTWSRAQQAALSDADVAAIKKEVTAAVDKYDRLFSEQNMKALPEEVYTIPWILLAANGPQADVTKEQAFARFDASLKQLLGNGWQKSVFTTDGVCVLNGSAAILSGRNTRYKQDGSVMSVGGVSYVFAKAKDGWKIVSYTGTPAGKVVRCD